MALRFFSIFYDFFDVFTIFDFFSKTMSQIVLKRGRNVPWRRVTQGCSVGSVALDPWFLTIFSIWVLIGQCIHSYWLLCKSMGIAMVIHIFNLISKTTIQIHFKLDGDVPWVGLYQVCSNGHDPVIFGFLMIFCCCCFYMPIDYHASQWGLQSQ